MYTLFQCDGSGVDPISPEKAAGSRAAERRSERVPKTGKHIQRAPCFLLLRKRLKSQLSQNYGTHLNPRFCKKCCFSKRINNWGLLPTNYVSQNHAKTMEGANTLASSQRLASHLGVFEQLFQVDYCQNKSWGCGVFFQNWSIHCQLAEPISSAFLNPFQGSCWASGSSATAQWPSSCPGEKLLQWSILSIGTFCESKGCYSFLKAHNVCD